MRGLLLSVSLFASVVWAQPQPDPVVVAAQEREAKMQRLAVAFTTDETRFLNSKNGVRELLLKGSFRLTLVGAQSRYDAELQLPHISGGPLSRTRIVSVTNVTDTREWTRIDEQSALTLGSADRMRALGEGSSLPLTSFVRGLLGESKGFDWRQTKPTGKQATFNDVACIEYQLTREKRTTSLWVAPTRGHTLQRIEERHDANLHRAFDVTYVADERLGWRPDTWTRTEWSEKQERRIVAKTTVTEWQNPAESPKGTFVIDLADLPDNTLVRDDRTNEEYILVGGAKQPVPVPVNTNPPSPPKLRQEWLYAIIAACLTLVVVGVFWLRQRRRA